MANGGGRRGQPDGRCKLGTRSGRAGTCGKQLSTTQQGEVLPPTLTRGPAAPPTPMPHSGEELSLQLGAAPLPWSYGYTPAARTLCGPCPAGHTQRLHSLAPLCACHLLYEMGSNESRAFQTFTPPKRISRWTGVALGLGTWSAASLTSQTCLEPPRGPLTLGN